jgi:hypothetical protein
MAKAKKKRPVARKAAKKRARGKRATPKRGATSASERPRDEAWRKLVERAVLHNAAAESKPGGKKDK